MRGVADDGQMRKFFDDRDRGEIECVARVGFEGTDAALAEHHVVVAAGKNVFGAEQQLLHGSGKAALQQHRLADFAESAEKIVVLHVARAHLEHVHIGKHHLNLRRVHHFADSRQAELVGGLAHELQAGLAHALKSVGRSARLESAATKDFRARFRDALRDLKNLLARFDRAGAGCDHHFRAADFDATAKIDDGSFRAELPAG